MVSGTTCRFDGETPSAAGLTRVEIHNRSDRTVGLFAAGVRGPKTWADALAWINSADLSAQDVAIPDWIVQIPAQDVSADAGVDATAMVDLPAGVVGVICGTGEWPDLTFTDAGPLTLGS